MNDPKKANGSTPSPTYVPESVRPRRSSFDPVEALGGRVKPTPNLAPFGHDFIVGTDRPWFLTLTRRQFFYDAPEAYEYTIEEIAHVLGNECRFGNHLPQFYSVAEHSVHVASVVRQFLNAELRERLTSRRMNEILNILRASLLHDAAEAFIKDLPRPLKYLPGMEAYRELDARITRAIFKRFDLEAFIGHPEIKRADNMVLRAEKEQLRGYNPDCAFDVDTNVTPADIQVLVLDQTAAADLFMRRWHAFA